MQCFLLGMAVDGREREQQRICSVVQVKMGTIHLRKTLILAVASTAAALDGESTATRHAVRLVEYRKEAFSTQLTKDWGVHAVLKIPQISTGQLQDW